MPEIRSISSRDMQRRWREVFDEVQKDGLPRLVTRNGKPAAVLMPVSEESYLALLSDLVLATSPQVAERIAQAEARREHELADERQRRRQRVAASTIGRVVALADKAASTRAANERDPAREPSEASSAAASERTASTEDQARRIKT